MNKVTVLLLTYNHDKTLARAFDSILEQKTDFAFGVHVLEDHSTDGTAEICRRYQARHPDKITLFLNETNLGVVKNFKSGLLRVDTPYMAFLEGDDYWCDPDKLQRQVEAMDRHPECMICGHNVLFKDLVHQTEHVFVEDEQVRDRTVFTWEDRLSIHPSARLYRNTIDLTHVPDSMVLDTHIYTLFLTKGDLYYIHRVMSVYNKTGEGYWSGMSAKAKRLHRLQLRYESNRFFGFKYEGRFYKTSRLLKFSKAILGVERGWWLFHHLERLRTHAKYLFRS